jgi:serine/threonine-protein kinase
MPHDLVSELRLVTLGGLTIQAGGVAMTGASTRRQRLAMFALLALVRDRGMSRDKLLGYLWPESEARRARHGLDQLLYYQRRYLDGGGLFTGRKTLRLNPTVITVDVWEFEDALDAGALESAVRLYAGPFLDGFFLRGAPEFDRWVEEQRARLRRRCADATVSLARIAAAADDPLRAVGWWRRAVEFDPFDTTVVRHLVEASLAVGDRAGALRHAGHHADLLRTELGIEADPGLERLIERAPSTG